jgi:hypothetical protein
VTVPDAVSTRTEDIAVTSTISPVVEDQPA